MKKTVIVTVVTAVVSFFSGAYWVCFKICQMVDDGVDVNQLAKDCMNNAEKDAEVRIHKWRRKYSRVHR